MSILLRSTKKSNSSLYQNILSDDNANVLMTTPQDAASAGLMKILDSEGNQINTTENGALEVSQANPILYDQVDGNAININKWNPYVVSGMTITQAGGFINLNAGSALTTGAYAILTSIKSIPLYGTLPLVVQFNAKVLNLPQTNAVLELGVGAGTGVTAPTDGAFFRWASNGTFVCVLNNGGVETATAALSGTITEADGISSVILPPVQIEAELYQIEIVEDQVLFSVGDVLVASLQVPTGQAYPFNAGRQTLFARVYNGGSSPSLAPQLMIGQVVVYQQDLNQSKDWKEVICAMGQGAYQSPVTTFSQTANHSNSTAPSSATLSNTAAGYTTLGGKFQFAAVGGAATDYALFAFQVPVAYQFYCTRISISLYNTVIAVAITPTIFEWAAGINSSAVSLATVDGAGTWAPRRIPLGSQALTVAALVGAAANDLVRSFDAPLVVDGGRYFHIILTVPVGTATATEVFRGTILVNGYFE